MLTLLALAAAAVQPAPSAPAAAELDYELIANPTPEAVQAGLDLFTGQDLREQMLTSTTLLMDQVIEARLAAMAKEGVEPPQDLLAKIRGVLAEETEALVDAVEPTFRLEAAMVYARHFTVEELRELKRLQSNPVMRKSERLAPSLMAELSAIGLKRSAERAPEMERRVREVVEEWLAHQMLSEGRVQS